MIFVLVMAGFSLSCFVIASGVSLVCVATGLKTALEGGSEFVGRETVASGLGFRSGSTLSLGGGTGVLGAACCSAACGAILSAWPAGADAGVADRRSDVSGELEGAIQKATPAIPAITPTATAARRRRALPAMRSDRRSGFRSSSC